MSKIVIKFGGSNFKTKEDIQKVIQLVKTYNQSVVIVVSALFGVTNQLIELIEKAKTGSVNINQLSRWLSDIHEKTLIANTSDSHFQEKVLEELKVQIREVKKLLIGIHCFREVPPFVYDAVLSYGEKLSSLLLSRIFEAEGLENENLFVEDIPLYTDGEYGNASVDFERSKEAVRNRLNENKTFIIPGFYGISYDEQKTTLLGRGGTDYSAAAIAKLIGAPSLDIWKDVNGFLSADPKIVDGSRRIDQLSYMEAAELAYFGAKILHPRTVEPLIEDNIPIRIFNINQYMEGIKPLSIISAEIPEAEDAVRSITYTDDIGLLKLRGPSVGIKPGILGKAATQLDQAEINIRSVITSQISINFFLSERDLFKAKKALEQTRIPEIGELLTVEGISKIAVIGKNIVHKEGIATRIFGAVAREGINMDIIALGASPSVAYFIVKKEDRSNALKAIHEEFFPVEDEMIVD
ncbi:aspartate kinase [Xanthovirga aplysinae]|uniref:aspartate kinase n=1 Tax=Xanthovirga aplysinae TaxID=2529853 RepID=UPI0012BD5EA4|nr:aspartate kinase [Xanthovirga aplysinae]MTI31612.1 aspartate kinase [Xanthovirga aplysinae]